MIALIDSLKHDILNPINPEDFETREGKSLAESLEELRLSMAEDKRRHQEQLSLCRERYGDILENTPVGVCITNENGIYEYVNNAYTDIYGYSKEELSGKHFTIVVPPQNRAEMTDLHEKFLGRKYELRGEWEVLRKEGTPITVLANAVYMVDSDGKAKKVTFVVDISDRKRAEEELSDTVEQLRHEIEERKKLEKARDNMERMVRHDMKNPLNGILGIAQLLMEEDLSEHHKELISVLTDSGKQLNAMIENFADYQQMEEGTYLLKPVFFDFAGFMKQICNDFRRIYALEKIVLVCKIDGVPMEEIEAHNYIVRGEPLHLKTVFENLLRNAYEASSEGDAITVDLFWDTSLRIEIHNRAPIPEEIRDTFFHRYVTSGKERGTGMGTYIAQMIIEYHGGKIDFSSDEAYGTTLYIDLPIKAESE